MKQHRASTKETVLVLGDELEQRVAMAARRLGVEPAEFIVRCLERRCAQVLDTKNHPGNTGELNGQTHGEATYRGWAIRPSETRVVRIIEELTHMPIEQILGRPKARAPVEARSMLAYLLTNDAGLSPVDAGRILHRRSATVNRLSASVEQIIGTDDARSELVAHARRLFRNGITSGKRYPPPPRRPSTSGELLVGLRVRRRMSNLTQPQLAARAGIARETLSRLERLKRRAQPETVKALARALNVAPDRLTDSRDDVPAVLWPPSGQVTTRWR